VADKFSLHPQPRLGFGRRKPDVQISFQREWEFDHELLEFGRTALHSRLKLRHLQLFVEQPPEAPDDSPEIRLSLGLSALCCSFAIGDIKYLRKYTFGITRFAAA
jgi:hypothetical protein